jgi:Arc/MetJ family transcription regulator
MRTSIDIDDELVSSVMRATGAATKREAVDNALRIALRLKRQEGLMELWGLGWDGDLDDMRTSKYIASDE